MRSLTRSTKTRTRGDSWRSASALMPPAADPQAVVAERVRAHFAERIGIADLLSISAR